MAKTVVIQFNDGTKWFIDDVKSFSILSNEGVYQLTTERKQGVFVSMDRVRMIGFAEDVYGHKEGI